MTDRRSVEEELSRVACPTLVLHGEDDRAIVLARAARTPNARLVVLPRPGHISTVEEPEAVTRELTPFLGES